ncbi:MAG: hypothetical protein JNG88_13960, partial [Phycisphaerales bacterium]|nr:hypothetical protein [Phycisphaerales bacterium]
MFNAATLQNNAPGGLLSLEGGTPVSPELHASTNLVDELVFIDAVLGPLGLELKLCIALLAGPGDRNEVRAGSTAADNDTTGYAVADLNTSGADGTWSASSGKLNCTGTCTPSGHSGIPDVSQGSLILIDGPAYQDVYITATGNISSGCRNAGLVVGYVDRLNFWVVVYSKTQQKKQVYQVSNGTWTKKSDAAFTISASTDFSMAAEARAGVVEGYAATIPAGKVGIWSSDGGGLNTAKFDDFKVRDMAGPYEADGRWFSDKGAVRVDDSNNNVLEMYNRAADTLDRCAVRRGFRGDKFVGTFRFQWNGSSGTSPGFLIRWLNPGDYLAIAVAASDGKPRLYKREADGDLTTLSTAGSALSLTSTNWYAAKVVIDNDPGNVALQRLRLYVDVAGDGFGNDSASIDTTAADDVWSAGYVGLYCGSGGTNSQQFDDFKVGYDNNGDGDADDAGDDVQIEDDFASGVVTLAYDNNGNLTDDGVYKYVYDAWNRLRKATRRVDAETIVGTYVYLADTRRASKVVGNSGVEATFGDGGNQTVHYYDDDRRNLIEIRNGSDETTRQFVWGGAGRSQPMFVDVNGDSSIDDDADVDVTTGGESGESPSDHRYFYHLDRAGRIVAITDYDKTSGAAANGRVIHRIVYNDGTRRSQPLEGVPSGGSSESARPQSSTPIGLPTPSNRMASGGSGYFNPCDPDWWHRQWNPAPPQDPIPPRDPKDSPPPPPDDCTTRINAALNEPRNQQLLAQLRASGCEPNFVCADCSDAEGGTYTAPTGRYGRGTITLCNDTGWYDDVEVIRHELLHAQFACGRSSRERNSHEFVACDELRAYACTGACDFPPEDLPPNFPRGRWREMCALSGCV